ncbi:MAG: hypothetical protein JXM79_17205 [Sedimentisphaerales bacterium]|nr:hypothetical protein [Sedimentisphaerales bacterium]
MPDRLNRRGFLRKSIVAPAAALAMSFEEEALIASTGKKPAAGMPGGAIKGLPTGKIGNVTISRLLTGGNLISGFAHSRDLIYVSSLLKQYFTDDKVMETFELCEECGINSAILRLDEHCIRIMTKYWNNRGGKLQWIAQVKMPSKDPLSDAKAAIDNGAVGAFVHGGIADECVAKNRVDLLAKAVEFIKQNGVIAGVGGHTVEVPMACEEAGLNVDFYMKTLHSHKYWSADRSPEHDNIWSKTPEKTIEFMKKVDKPWIAYKVMAAGAIHPRHAFKYAYEGGADFICAGMFDFQVREDVILTKDALSGQINRQRPWRA